MIKKPANKDLQKYLLSLKETTALLGKLHKKVWLERLRVQKLLRTELERKKS